MKMYKYILLFVIVVFTATSCGLDNYDAPQSRLHGKITYNGQTLGLRGTGEAVRLQLYQDGYQLHDNIQVYVDQNGTFEALLFDGEYKLVTRDRNGPWVNTRDTIVVNLKGSTEIEVPVTPFFTIDNESITLNGSMLNATFNVNKIVSTANIDYVTLLVSKTSFVDDATNIARKDFKEVQAGSQNLSLDLSGNANVASAKALFARVGVRTVGADQAIYSEVVRIK
ncbi:MAG: DUF3823 domain-containing protein [Proteiniphilum sp.]|jgi:hypothetical protein|nr:DUF3823 domain-containing protein [Proteiniphilum sp.]MDD2936697.1 DUF3823 domain-containing protein [Proteiniphilum sp.]MDD3075599.1 DUF3823 domain-containing protein [Proteiniphilum sp.]MDD3779516.1 DUF3823 domain-containing protein [Proteiniphilum sp.]MDD3956502.1 DUF3823 domain-containing protein [Proteiniphilum sp.]